MSAEAELIPRPLRFVICDPVQDDSYLCCPVCGAEFVAPTSLAAAHQGMFFATSARSMSITTFGKSKARRALIHLGFECDAGHKFEYSLTSIEGRVRCELSSRAITDEERSAPL